MSAPLHHLQKFRRRLGTVDYYEVTAVNSAGESGLSAEASATPHSALPGGWSQDDLNSPPLAGSADYDANSDTWTVTGSGWDIFDDGAEDYHFVHTDLVGDGIVSAKVTAVQNTSDWAKGGLVIRNGTATGSAYAAVVVTPAAGAMFGWRNTTNGTVTWTTVTGVTPPQYLKLDRSGQSVSAFYSANGTSWTQIGSTQTIALDATAQAGLAVAAHNGSQTNTSTFTAVGLTVAATVPDAPTNLSAVGGDGQVDLAWDAASGAETYSVYRGTTADGENATPIQSGVTGTTYTDSTVTNGTEYFYKVTAVNAGGESAQSNEASATPQVAIPTAPANLDAVAGDAQVTLTWDAATGAASYSVYRGTSADGEDATPIQTGVTGTTYTDSTVTNGTEYFYKVTAVNAGGESSQSTEASATPSADIPDAPSNLSASLDNNGVTLSWTNPSGLTDGFINFYASTDGGQSFTYMSSAGLDQTSLQLWELTPSTSYTFYATAQSDGGESSASNTSNAITSPARPSTPGNLNATLASGTGVDLAWDAATGANSYVVYRSETANDSGAVAMDVVTGTAYTDPYPINGTAYYYHVTALNASGQSGISNEPSATPPITAPTGLTATAVSPTQIDLSWTPGAGNTEQFLIERSTDGGMTWVTAATVDGSQRTYSDAGQDVSTSYSYQVTAVNPGGDSNPTNPATQSTPAAQPGLSGELFSGAQAVLNWTDGDGWHLEMEQTEAEKNNFHTSSMPSQASFGSITTGGLEGGKEYLFRLRGDRDGKVVYSDTVHVATIGAPTGLSADPISNSEIDLEWDASNVGGADGIVIESSRDGTHFETLGSVGAAAEQYSATGLADSTTYTFRVRAFKGQAYSGGSSDSATTLTGSAPDAPSGLSATTDPSDEAGTTITTFTWSSNTTADDTLEVQMRSPDYPPPPGGQEWMDFASVSGDQTTFDYYIIGTWTPLNPDTTFEFRMRAVNSGGASDWSNTASCTTSKHPDEFQMPAAPSGLKATGVSSTHLDLSWSDNSDNETAFSVLGVAAGQYDPMFGWMGPGAGTDPNVTSVSLTELQPDTTYYFVVESYRVEDRQIVVNYGHSRYSNMVTVHTPPAGQPPATETAPAAPANLSAAVNYANKEAKVSLLWDNTPDNEDNYIVERSTDNGGSWHTVATTSKDVTTYLDTISSSDVSPPYYNLSYRVTAKNSAGSAVSGIVGVLLDVSGPDITSQLPGLAAQVHQEFSGLSYLQQSKLVFLTTFPRTAYHAWDIGGFSSGGFGNPPGNGKGMRTVTVSGKIYDQQAVDYYLGGLIANEMSQHVSFGGAVLLYVDLIYANIYRQNDVNAEKEAWFIYGFAGGSLPTPPPELQNMLPGQKNTSWMTWSWKFLPKNGGGIAP